MTKELEGRVALVTGASSGIGKAAALLFAAHGARVGIAARSIDELRRMAEDNTNLFPIECDVSDERQIEHAFEALEHELGPCDLLLNNAGMILPRLVVDTTTENWDRHFAVNIRAVFLATRRVLPGMMNNNRGTIVNVASISGIAGLPKYPGFGAYCAAKAAVIAFTEATSSELQGTNVRINSVSPGSVDTKMLKEASESFTPSMTTEEVAETILFLSTERSRPLNGQNIGVYAI